MLQRVFWGACAGVIYPYLGYPLLLQFILWRKDHERLVNDSREPSLSLIVTVHNEEPRIEEKILNSLQLEYPYPKLEIIVASDASTDATEDIVRRYGPRGVNLVRSPDRRGKEAAQKCAIAESSGEILIFSDVATMLEAHALMRIAANFGDGTVGCVSSEDRYVDAEGRVTGEGAYVRYEMWLRSLESRVYSVVGLSGSFFAVRREVCREWPEDKPSDFFSLINAIRGGYRGISDPGSLGFYAPVRDEKKEFDRKVRTITRGIAVLMDNLDLLNPLKFGIFSWQLVSHKLMRWLVPAFLVCAGVSNSLLALKKGIYALLLLPHVMLYLLAGYEILGQGLGQYTRLPGYFLRVNLAVMVAWYRYFRGERFAVWDPSKR